VEAFGWRVTPAFALRASAGPALRRRKPAGAQRAGPLSPGKRASTSGLSRDGPRRVPASGPDSSECHLLLHSLELVECSHGSETALLRGR
jgi:hypothetical protein